MRAADRSGIRWLRAELPELVASGVLSAEAAAKVEGHYAAQPPGEPHRIGFILSAVLGSLLVGGGVILLVAHNWDFLSRPVRCTIGFLPLVLTQILSVWVLLRREGSASWRESAGILNIAAIGTAIALIAQTYQIQGDFARFILVWMLLAIPVIYLLRTDAGLSAFFVGAAVWVISSKTGDFFGTKPNDLWVWPLLGLGLPAFIALLRRNRNGYGALLAASSLAVAAAFALSKTNEMGANSFWRCSFAGFWCVVYLVGVNYGKDWRPSRAHPFVAAGWIGILSLAIYLSFKDSWRAHQWQSAVDGISRHYPDALAAGIQIAWVLAALLLGAFTLWRMNWRFNLAPAAVGPVALVAWLIAKRTRDPLVPALLLNLFGLGLGIFTLIRGVRAGRVYEANLGMAVITALAIVRFFDSDFEFVVRGIAFIVIGAGFLVTNLIVFKRKARA